jgi:EAL domain-containing protein (putative c-di-GMP-specific phosphodiesterase class I)
MENLEEAATAISSLQQLGVDASIDDFGTGYSSLGYLRRLPFDSLKMDRTLVADLTTDPQALAVAEGLIQLARSLKRRVTAEGVETREQLAILERFGCDQLQGYLASRPLSVVKMGEALRTGGRSPQCQDKPRGAICAHLYCYRFAWSVVSVRRPGCRLRRESKSTCNQRGCREHS